MIFWYDLETTGTATNSEILEIGAVVTDDALEEVDARSWVVAWQTVGTLRRSCDPVVRDMHDENGLWAEVLRAEDSLASVEAQVRDWLHELQPEGQFVQGGSGILHFDYRFLAARMPWVAKRLTYWGYDAGVVRRFAQRGGLEVPRFQTRSHRALDDARAALEQWRWLQDQLL